MKKIPQIKTRALKFNKKTITKIWQEIPNGNNPYLVESALCHGYDLFELIKKKSFVEVLFLLFVGEIPTKEQTCLLETLLIGLINPGPRHPATRAAMNAAVSRTNPSHFLPIGLSVLSGDHLGGNEVISSMRFLIKNIENDPAELANNLIKKRKRLEFEGDFHIAPGFGSRFNDIDPLPEKIISQILMTNINLIYPSWGQAFSKELNKANMGWLSTGLAAVVFCELGIDYRAGAGLFQLFNAPGILAHGVEMANKPITSMPFVDDKNYIIADEAKKN